MKNTSKNRSINEYILGLLIGVFISFLIYFTVILIMPYENIAPESESIYEAIEIINEHQAQP